MDTGKLTLNRLLEALVWSLMPGRCPWGNDPRSKVCALWGDACKFAAHGMHGIDETTVKTTKVV